MDSLVMLAILQVMECDITTFTTGTLGRGTTATLAAMDFVTRNRAVARSY